EIDHAYRRPRSGLGEESVPSGFLGDEHDHGGRNARDLRPGHGLPPPPSGTFTFHSCSLVLQRYFVSVAPPAPSVAAPFFRPPQRVVAAPAFRALLRRRCPVHPCLSSFLDARR